MDREAAVPRGGVPMLGKTYDQLGQIGADCGVEVPALFRWVDASIEGWLPAVRMKAQQPCTLD